MTGKVTVVDDEGADGQLENPLPAARRRVDPFVSETFSWHGTLLLHRHASGWDLLRAPVNVALAPIHLLVRLLAAMLGFIRCRGAAEWRERRPIVLPTAVSRHVEKRVAAKLLGIPALDSTRSTLWVHSAPSPLLEDILRKAGSDEVAGRRLARARRSLRAYSATRTAVSEITTALIVLAVGAFLLRSLTPGVVSMAPKLADALVRDTAIEGFPLGSTIGAVWYGAFPVGASACQIALTVVALMTAASLVTNFAGLVADPIQAHLGIHQRRLLRLIDTVESDLTGSPPRSFVAREHYYARIADLFDAVAGLLRYLR